MHKILTLSILISILSTTLTAQHYRFFSRPGGDQLDFVSASCIQNDTVYALIQSGYLGVNPESSFYKIPVSTGEPELIKSIPPLRGYMRPQQLIISDNSLYLAHMPLDTLQYRYRLDRYSLEDFSLIASHDYIVKENASGFPKGHLVSLGDKLIIGGSQNELLNEDGDLGFVIWIDKETMEADSLIIYDDPDHFFNGVHTIGTFQDTLVVAHSTGGNSNFNIKLYDDKMSLISDEPMITILDAEWDLPTHNIFDDMLVTTGGEVIVTVRNNAGYRKFDVRGTDLGSFLDVPDFPSRRKHIKRLIETREGDILYFGSGLIFLDELEPEFSDIDFEVAGHRKSAFATRLRFKEFGLVDKLWDYSYIEFDNYGNNKYFNIDIIHETENGDLFGFGQGSEVMDSFDFIFRQAKGDIWTFRMGSDGCIQENSCGQNEVYNFLTRTDDEQEEEKVTTAYRIFPQPTSDRINLELSQDLNFQYELFDFQGRLIKMGHHYKTVQITTQDLVSGSYLLRVNNESSGELILSEVVQKI